MYGMYRIFAENVREKGYKWSFLPLVVGLTGIIQSHVLTGEMVRAVILLVCILLIRRTLQKERFWELVKAAFVTVALNLWFLVPFADFMLTQDVLVFNQSEEKMIQSTGVLLTQLLPRLVQGRTRALGLALPLGVILCAVMIWVSGREWSRERRCGLFVLFLTVLQMWMSTVYFPWDAILLRFPFMRNGIINIQYLWRFLSPATLLAVAATGFALLLLWKKEGVRVFASVGTLLCVLSIISGMLLIPERTDETRIFRLNSTKGIGTVVVAGEDEYLPVDAERQVMTEVLDARIYNGDLVYYEKHGTTVNFAVNDIEEDCYVLLPLLNYKGYRVISEDGSITNDNLSTGENAVVRIDIPKEYSGGVVTVRYQAPWYWHVAEILSVLSIVVLVISYCRDKRK